VAFNNGFAKGSDLDQENWKTVSAKLIEQSGVRGFGGWSEHWSRAGEFPWAWAVFESCLNHLGLAEPGKEAGIDILESGCGATLMPLWLASQGCRVIGVDLDGEWEPDWRALRGAAKVGAQGMTFRKQDMEALNFPSDSFDLAYSLSAIEHTNDPCRAVTEMLRVVRPGGLVVLTCDVEISGGHGLLQDELERLYETLAQEACPYLPWRPVGCGAMLTRARTRKASQRAWKSYGKNILEAFGRAKPPEFSIFAYAGVVR